MGDFALHVSSNGGLEAFAAKFQALASGKFQHQVSEAAGNEIKGLVEAEFRSSTDPYGRSWTPTKAGNTPLIGKTKNMSTSVDMKVLGDGFLIIVTDWKALFHQAGTVRGIPARPMLPVNGSMPPAWRTVIENAVRAQLHAALG